MTTTVTGQRHQQVQDAIMWTKNYNADEPQNYDGCICLFSAPGIGKHRCITADASADPEELQIRMDSAVTKFITAGIPHSGYSFIDTSRPASSTPILDLAQNAAQSMPRTNHTGHHERHSVHQAATAIIETKTRAEDASSSVERAV